MDTRIAFLHLEASTVPDACPPGETDALPTAARDGLSSQHIRPMGSPLRVYVAAPKTQVLRARELAAKLPELGIEVASRWHSKVEPTDRDPDDQGEARHLLEENLGDLKSAHVVLALTAENEGRGVYTEIGRALAQGKVVVWSLQKDGRALDWVDPLVWHAWTDGGAVRTLEALSRMRARAVL